MQTVDLLHHPLIPQKKQKIIWDNLHGSSMSLALSILIEKSKQPVLIITADTSLAMRLEYEIQFFQMQDFPIISFPDWETLPYDHFSPHQDIISSRLAALSRIPTLTSGVIITSISTLLHRLPPTHYLTGNVFFLRQGDQFNIEKMRSHLEKSGYRCVNQVQEHGEYAVRGSLVDLFPMGSNTPYRIDLFDDEIDSIRTFSIETQRSVEQIEKIELLPAKEFPLSTDTIDRFKQNWRSQFGGNPLKCPNYSEISEGICFPGIEYYLPFFFDNTSTLFDYLPENSLIISCESIHTKAEEFWREINARYEQRSHDITHPILTPQQLFLSVSDTFQQLKNYAEIQIHNGTFAKDSNQHVSFNTGAPLVLTVDYKAEKPLQLLENFLSTYTGRILFCAETPGRREALLQLLNSISIRPKQYTSWQTFLNDHAAYGIIVATLDEGFNLLNPAITLIAESQLFGKRVLQSRRRKGTIQESDALIKNLSELQIGGPIVHIDHGVGRYLGLQIMTVGDYLGEFLAIEYAGGDKLYVPVSALHLINRYSGVDPEHAPLNKLGTGQWQKAKRKAAEQVCDVAAELLDLYARRAAQKKLVSAIIDEQYTKFAAEFPFEETPDQQTAIDQVIQDMMLDKPMDRLVCGDVGFGKTEVAMRAAFVAVQNGKQVAVLVPTTLLAQQHYLNFQDRFAEWPIQIDVISRFKNSKEQQKALQNLAEGKSDIIIGTHKLLQTQVKFKALGLLIIDEEHRFGVKQKEYLKSLRANIDILMLTATPIPRTLNMAFSGIRDLSLIATPPARRLSVKTFVHEYNPVIIQEAVLREVMRGGQVYFLHNDVASIEKIARELMKLIPEARIGIAHGQMRERELEVIMADFYHRRFNVLVCTTIIESGIDIPSANTIIINRADKLGLAQLHQLRGRVGRSHHQAYAYLLIPSRKLLANDAEKRLDAIATFEDLGIGFTLATQDLEIRGAGELLGEGQSGNMHAIGFTLYMDLLSRAVSALKNGKTLELNETLSTATEIDLQIPAFIPENYLMDVHLRLQCYKRIASTKNVSELEEIQVEMIDRFGLLPMIAKNLFAVTELKLKAEALGIKKIEANSKISKIEFHDKPLIDPIKLIKLIQSESQRYRLEGPKILKVTLAQHQPMERIKLIEQLLNKF